MLDNLTWRESFHPYVAEHSRKDGLFRRNISTLQLARVAQR